MSFHFSFFLPIMSMFIHLCRNIPLKMFQNSNIKNVGVTRLHFITNKNTFVHAYDLMSLLGIATVQLALILLFIDNNV